MSAKISPPFQIKICGITRPVDAISAFQAGADAIGLNFYPDSPRFVNPRQASEIVKTIEKWADDCNQLPPHVFGVFVNASAEKICETTFQFRLTGIQLHGDEPLSAAEEIRQAISLNGAENNTPSVKLVRAFRPVPQDAPGDSDRLHFREMLAEASRWMEAGIDAILLDAASPGTYGGSGLKLDWSKIGATEWRCPIVLAGGLNPANVAEAIRMSNVTAVDVASGVETCVGQKDEHLMRLFVRNTGWKRK